MGPRVKTIGLTCIEGRTVWGDFEDFEEDDVDVFIADSPKHSVAVLDAMGLLGRVFNPLHSVQTTRKYDSYPEVGYQRSKLILRYLKATTCTATYQ